jgi:CxxC motif-containing protein (DUF1111 family)
MRFLAPIERSEINPSILEGEALFESVGCSSCHRAVLMTGSNRNPLFDRRPVALYSDLLLHDIGKGDGVEQAAATTEEMRTPALWGLRFRRPLLHDGSAATLEDAILRHQGEARSVTARFLALLGEDKRRLLAFLRSL